MLCVSHASVRAVLVLALCGSYFHAAALDTPLLVHSNTNDEDVNVMEVEHLIDALKAMPQPLAPRVDGRVTVVNPVGSGD